MYRTILVPLDGSPFAEHALPVLVQRPIGARRAEKKGEAEHVVSG
jgi:hypothetical protein